VSERRNGWLAWKEIVYRQPVKQEYLQAGQTPEITGNGTMDSEII